MSERRVVTPKSGGVARAFALVELLAVLGIIAVLAALLLPALGRGREAAWGARCAANLRQFGLAARMYWDDHQGDCFRYGGALTNGGRLYWFGWMGGGSEGARAFDPAPGALYPYLPGRGVELCPSLNYALPRFKLKAASPAHGYGYNLHLSAPPTRPPVNAAEFARPSALVVFADAAQVNTFQAPASRDNPMLEEFYYVATNRHEATAHFRHAARAQAVFADGHVAPERMAPGSLDARLPEQRVGRLRDEILLPR